MPYPVVRAPLTGLDTPWGAEIVLEGEVRYGTREIEGRFGEFTGLYSGGRSLPVVTVRRVHMRRNPLFEHLYLGSPWTEIDYLIAPLMRDGRLHAVCYMRANDADQGLLSDVFSFTLLQEFAARQLASPWHLQPLRRVHAHRRRQPAADPAGPRRGT